MKTAVFKSFKNGYYTFWFDNGDDMTFDEVHPKVLKQFDLDHDKTWIDKEFRISYVEVFDASVDEMIYRIESLKLIS